MTKRKTVDDKSTTGQTSKHFKLVPFKSVNRKCLYVKRDETRHKDMGAFKWHMVYRCPQAMLIFFLALKIKYYSMYIDYL